MKEKISSRLRLLLCFGVIVFISLAAPQNVEAHNENTLGREPGVVYDGDNPWDGTSVGWFTHDKEIGSKAKGYWYTKGYYVTTYPLLDYTIPAGALQVTPLSTDGLGSWDCTNSGYLDTPHLFNRSVIKNWCMQSGATIADDGTMTVYAQPVIGTKTKTKSGSWKDDGKTITSLTDWINAKVWTNTSTFASHYNKPLKIVYAPTIPSECTQVQYQALNDGDGYSAGRQLRDGTSYSYNIGSVHSYGETGLISYFDTVINGETRRFVLAGVRVDKPAGCVVGTVGRLAVSTEEDNLVVPSGSYATIDGSLSDVGVIPGSGWTFRRDYSRVHSYMNGCNFRVSTGTTITYLYAEVKTVCKLYTAMRFDGYNTWGGAGSIAFRTINVMGSAIDYTAWQQCVSGYNGGVNCWTSSSLPINGTIEASTRFKAVSSQKAYEVAMVDGKVTKRTTTCTVNQAPIIFVTVYEGGPVLTVKSLHIS